MKDEGEGGSKLNRWLSEGGGKQGKEKYILQEKEINETKAEKKEKNRRKDRG